MITQLIILFISISIALIVTFGGTALQYIGGIKMNYKKFINDVYEELRIVLACIFTIGYMMGSIVVFICTWAVDRLANQDADYTIDLEILGRRMYLTTKEKG